MACCSSFSTPFYFPEFCLFVCSYLSLFSSTDIHCCGTRTTLWNFNLVFPFIMLSNFLSVGWIKEISQNVFTVAWLSYTQHRYFCRFANLPPMGDRGLSIKVEWRCDECDHSSRAARWSIESNCKVFIFWELDKVETFGVAEVGTARSRKWKTGKSCMAKKTICHLGEWKYGVNKWLTGDELKVRAISWGKASVWSEPGKWSSEKVRRTSKTVLWKPICPLWISSVFALCFRSKKP